MTASDLLRQESVQELLRDLAALGGGELAVLSPAGAVVWSAAPPGAELQQRLARIGAAVAAEGPSVSRDADGQPFASAPVTCAGEVTGVVVVLPGAERPVKDRRLQACAHAGAQVLTRLSHAEFEITSTVRELTTTYEELAAVCEASELVADASLSLRSVAQVMLRRTAETVSALRGCILFQSAPGVGPVGIVSTVGMNPDEQARSVSALREWLAVAQERGWLQPVSYQGGLDGWPDGRNVPILIAPLTTEAGHVGAIAVARPDGTPFSARDAKLLSATARQTAMAVKNKGLVAELQEMFLSTIRALAAAIEQKDPYTRGHSERVAALARSSAAFYDLSEAELKRIHLAGLLHDIGKIGVSEQTLCKTGPLSDEQWIEMRAHPVRGAEIIGCVPQLGELVDAVRHHHERYDGSGYPDGIEGEGLTPQAAILCVCDALDAMTSQRVYRPNVKTMPEACAELRRCAGTQFQPDAVSAVLHAVEERQQRARLLAAS